jgi:hypoxanthine phosphoribosyltransferase
MTITLDTPLETLEKYYKQAVCLYDEVSVSDALDGMAMSVTEALWNKKPLVLCVMMGGMMVTSSLVLRLKFPLEVGYVHVSSYEQNHQHTLVWKVPMMVDVKKRHVLIVDDVLDSGLTLQAILDACYHAGALSVKTAVLLNKDKQRAHGGLERADFFGFLLKNDPFVVGYGLNYGPFCRNLPGIFILP